MAAGTRGAGTLNWLGGSKSDPPSKMEPEEPKPITLCEAGIDKPSKTLRDLRIAEISTLDVTVEDGKIKSYRAKVRLSFKHEGGS
jgi:flavin-binding protein dodecin